MTSCIDGPAVGQTLMLKRAPLYLRVVQRPTGEWDALDQLHDTPADDERIVAYVMVGESTFCHINRGRLGSGFFRGGRYCVVADQPTDEQMRSTNQWRAWCSAKVGQPIGADGTIEESTSHE